MHIIRVDRHLPTQPGACLYAQVLQRQRHQAACYLLARRDDGIVFARIMQRADLVHLGDEVIRDTRHGGQHDGNFIAPVMLPLYKGGNMPDTIKIAH